MSLGTLLKSIKDQVSDHLFAQMSDLPPAPIIYNPFLVTDNNNNLIDGRIIGFNVY